MGELFAELSHETRTLVQQELQLAKMELTEKASQVGKAAGLIVGGGLIAYGGLLAIIAALVLILIAIGFPPWSAALVGGVLVAGIGYLLIRFGLAALEPQELTPEDDAEGDWSLRRALPPHAGRSGAHRRSFRKRVPGEAGEVI